MKDLRRRRNKGKRRAGRGGEGAEGGVKVCYAFQKNECTRGEECKFAHELAQA